MNIYPSSDNDLHSDILDQSTEDGMRKCEQKYFLEVEEKRRIDSSKLLFPIYVDYNKCQTSEQLFYELKNWWTQTKGRAEKTIDTRIKTARYCMNHQIYPINWFNFDEQPEQVINLLMYLINVEYKNKAKQTGNQNYGINQIHNIWKTIKTFAEAKGVDVKWWGWNPPARPENKVKIIPKPVTVNKLMHYHYSNDKYINALTKTILTVGFNSGLRPEELIILQVKNVDFENNCLIITEQKKRYRNRQIRMDPPILHSHQQNSLSNYIYKWRTRITDNPDGFLFLQKNGKPFPSEDALRRYLARKVKPVWKPFSPKKMRDWNAIARLIRTKEKKGIWDIREVTKALGHKHQTTTEIYIEFAEIYYENDKYDWLRAVLKHQKCLMQDYRSCQAILTNHKKRSPERKVTPVGENGPMGEYKQILPLFFSTNTEKRTSSTSLTKSFFLSLRVGVGS